MKNKTKIIGILNITDDSFSDGGKYIKISEAINHIKTMVLNGCCIIDIGAESTKPGFKEVSAEDQLLRILPIIDEIKKIKEDIERYSFNTPVSAFMICVNELTALKCNKIEILSDLCIILSPYAPHICEELWSKLGKTDSISYATFPKYKEEYLAESRHKYPISFNGKMKFLIELPVELSKNEIEDQVLANEKTIKILSGKEPKKIIVVPKKIVNIVI